MGLSENFIPDDINGFEGWIGMKGQISFEGRGITRRSVSHNAWLQFSGSEFNKNIGGRLVCKSFDHALSPNTVYVKRQEEMFRLILLLAVKPTKWGEGK